MSTIRGTMKNGTVVFENPPDWPEGAEVIVDLEPNVPVRMMTEDEQGDDPESIAKWIAWADQIQPLIMTPEEEAEWQKARAEQKAWELANWDAHSKKIEDLFK